MCPRWRRERVCLFVQRSGRGSCSQGLNPRISAKILKSSQIFLFQLWIQCYCHPILIIILCLLIQTPTDIIMCKSQEKSIMSFNPIQNVFCHCHKTAWRVNKLCFIVFLLLLSPYRPESNGAELICSVCPRYCVSCYSQGHSSNHTMWYSGI